MEPHGWDCPLIKEGLRSCSLGLCEDAAMRCHLRSRAGPPTHQICQYLDVLRGGSLFIVTPLQGLLLRQQVWTHTGLTGGGAEHKLHSLPT